MSSDTQSSKRIFLENTKTLNENHNVEKRRTKTLDNIFTNKIFSREYIVLFIFISFKTIFNYKKCTISYIECKFA